MSTVEYTACDGGCGRVTPEPIERIGSDPPLGWAQLITFGKSYDLCPECAKKAMEAVGIETGR